MSFPKKIYYNYDHLQKIFSPLVHKDPRLIEYKSTKVYKQRIFAIAYSKLELYLVLTTQCYLVTSILNLGWLLVCLPTELTL